MKYCSRCGAELVDEAVVCTKCGCAVGTAGQIMAGVSGVGQKFLGGLVALVLGVVGLIYSISAMNSVKWEFVSAFSDGPTGYQIITIVILIISIVVAIVGVVLLISGKLIDKSKVDPKALKKVAWRVRLVVWTVGLIIAIVYCYVHFIR